MSVEQERTQRKKTYTKFADDRPPTERQGYLGSPHHNALYHLAKLAWETREELSNEDPQTRRSARKRIVDEALDYIQKPEKKQKLPYSWPGEVSLIIEHLLDTATKKSNLSDPMTEIAGNSLHTRIITLNFLNRHDILETFGPAEKALSVMVTQLNPPPPTVSRA